MLDEKFWEKYFKVYDVLNIVIPYQELLSELEKELDLKNNDVVLDVGSGTGNLAIMIKDKCKEVIGIDYSIEGTKRHKMKDPDAKVIIHDITDTFPFPDNYFSKVVSNNTIYTLTKNQQVKTLSEIYRVMKPGGKFVMSNIKKEYSPLSIYFCHISKGIKKYGFLKNITLLIKMIIPTLKMFYYNNRIKRNNSKNNNYFLEREEQKKILEKVGFDNLNEKTTVFANQAFLISVYKTV